MIKRVYVIPFKEWFFSTKSKIYRSNRNGEMALIPTITIVHENEEYNLDASNCVVVEEVKNEL